MKQPIADKYLTVKDAAELIGCSEGRVRQMARDDVLTARKAGETVWLIPVSEAKRVRDLPYKTGRPRISADSS